MGKTWKSGLALALAAVMAVSAAPDTSWAAKKTMKLSKSTVTLKTGKSTKVTIKNKTGSKIKKVTYKVTKGKKLISLTKKTKSYVKIKGKKKGTAKIKVTIQTKKKKYTKYINVKVKKAAATKTDKKTNTNTNTNTNTEKKTDTNTEKKSTETVEDDTPEPDTTVELAHYDMSVDADGETLVDKSGNGHDGTLNGIEATKEENDSLYLDGAGGYIELPKDIFVGQDTVTISAWFRNYSGKMNTSAMFVGTTESLPLSYWLLNPSNTDGRMKSVFTDSVSATNEPWNTEVGISASSALNRVMGPFTDKNWSHYVTVITPTSLTGYYNGTKVGSVKLTRKFSDFGEDIVAYIGKSSYTADSTFCGYVREVSVFRGAKTDKQVKALYKATNNIKSDTGENTNVKTQKSEIFIADRADPYIVKAGKYKDDDPNYYFTASYPMYGANDAEGYDRLILRKSATLEGLRTAEEKVIWNQKDSTTTKKFIWAPEMHYIGGKWYMFFAASDDPNNPWHIDCHVMMCKGQDPYNDEWEDKGKFQAAPGDSTSFKGFSLDMTYFENDGTHYVIWAEKKATVNNGISTLFMAEIDPEEPWKCITKPMTLTTPEYAWEKQIIPVNEGPSVIKHDGKVIVAFSASATGPEYCIGLIHADEHSDLMDPDSWTKEKKPALTSDDLIEEYGPGHNSFTEDDDGNPIFVYHSRPQNCYDGKCGYSNGDPLYDPCRSAHLRRVVWDENGLPVLNAEPYNKFGGYLYTCFAHTKSNDRDVQQLHFFLSEDGLNWTAVNGCMPAYMTGTDYPTDNYAFEKDWKQTALTSKTTYSAVPGATGNGAFYNADDIKETASGDASALFPFEGRDHGLRDPYIVRGSLKDGSDADTIRILATDLNIYDKQYDNVNWGMMTSFKQAGDNYETSGSAGSKQLFIFETKDFVNWERRTVDVANQMKGGCAWAPEAIYNPDKDNYLVYWSCRTEADGFARNRLYCNETRDFKTFGPTKLYEQEDFYKTWGKYVKNNCGYGNIDTSQLWVADGDNPYGTLYRLVKDETNNHVQLMKANSVLDPNVDYDLSDPILITPYEANGKTYSKISDLSGNEYDKAPIVWNWFKDESTGDHFEKISQKDMEKFWGAFEGPTMFKFFDRDEWCVMIDNYGNNSVRYEPYLTTDLSKEDSIKKAAAGTYGRTGDDVGCHGGVIPITAKEYNQIISTFNDEDRYAAVTGIAKDKIRTQANAAGCVYHDIATIK